MKTIKFATRLHGNNRAVRAYNKGSQEFYSYCLSSGIVIRDDEYVHCGELNRVYHTLANGLLCKIKLVNGAITEFSVGCLNFYNEDKVYDKLTELSIPFKKRIPK